MQIRMLKLLPDQVARHWDEIGYAIINSLPPTVLYSADMRYLTLEAVLDGRLEVWAVYTVKEDRSIELLVILTTAFVYDVGSSYKSLLIYSIYGWQRDVSPRDWIEGMRMIKEYAKSNGCKNVLAYSNVESVIGLVKRLGGNVDFSLMVMEV